MSPKDDPTSLGAILLAMGIITPHQLNQAIDEQDNSSIEIMLGKLLIANGMISTEQLEIALHAQVGLRSKKRDQKAKAQAVIAETGSASIVALAKSVRDKIEDTKRSRTGDSYPAVTNMMSTSKKV